MGHRISQKTPGMLHVRHSSSFCTNHIEVSLRLTIEVLEYQQECYMSVISLRSALANSRFLSDEH